MENKKSSKKKNPDFKEEIEKLKADIEWLQRQINELKYKKNNKGH
jgi:peptidoglycan hydrolase CwlO-like protein